MAEFPKPSQIITRAHSASSGARCEQHLIQILRDSARNERRRFLRRKEVRNGLKMDDVPENLPYSVPINRGSANARAEALTGFSALVAYACAVNETIQGELNGLWVAATV